MSSFVNLSNAVENLNAQMKRLEWEKQHFEKIIKLQKEISLCTCSKPLHSTLLKTDKDVQSFTGLDSRGMFDSLHDYIAPFVRRRWKGVTRVVNKVRRCIIGQQKKRRTARKRCSQDEFLLTLLRLRLALLHFDLAKRFKISRTLSGQIFNCWIRAMALVLRPMIYIYQIMD